MTRQPAVLLSSVASLVRINGKRRRKRKQKEHFFFLNEKERETAAPITQVASRILSARQTTPNNPTPAPSRRRYNHQSCHCHGHGRCSMCRILHLLCLCLLCGVLVLVLNCFLESDSSDGSLLSLIHGSISEVKKKNQNPRLSFGFFFFPDTRISSQKKWMCLLSAPPLFFLYFFPSFPSFFKDPLLLSPNPPRHQPPS